MRVVRQMQVFDKLTQLIASKLMVDSVGLFIFPDDETISEWENLIKDAQKSINQSIAVAPEMKLNLSKHLQDCYTRGVFEVVNKTKLPLNQFPEQCCYEIEDLVQ